MSISGVCCSFPVLTLLTDTTMSCCRLFHQPRCLRNRRNRISPACCLLTWAGVAGFLPIWQKKRTPPCCAVGQIIKRRLRITSVADFTRILPAEPNFCRHRQGENTMLGRRPFQQPASTCCRRRRLSSGASVESPHGPTKPTFCQL